MERSPPSDALSAQLLRMTLINTKLQLCHGLVTVDKLCEAPGIEKPIIMAFQSPSTPLGPLSPQSDRLSTEESVPIAPLPPVPPWPPPLLTPTEEFHRNCRSPTTNLTMSGRARKKATDPSRGAAKEADHSINFHKKSPRHKSANSRKRLGPSSPQKETRPALEFVDEPIPPKALNLSAKPFVPGAGLAVDEQH